MQRCMPGLCDGRCHLFFCCKCCRSCCSMLAAGRPVLCCAVLCRSTPAKRYIGVGWAVSAGGMWSIVRWAFGTWAPGIQQVIFSPVGVWYVIITGTAGVAVTYWLDDPHSRKINTTIRVSLQIVALGALYFAVADDYVALALMGLLVCFGWLWAICRCAAAVQDMPHDIISGSQDTRTSKGISRPACSALAAPCRSSFFPSSHAPFLFR